MNKLLSNFRRNGTYIYVTQKDGVGDRLHKVFGPIGKAIHWPCMKGDGTMDLKLGSPCDKARAALNSLTKKG